MTVTSLMQSIESIYYYVMICLRCCDTCVTFKRCIVL